MAAALDTTERGPKTTKARALEKATRKRETLAQLKAKYADEIAGRLADALASADGHPVLVAHVEAWLPLAQVEADLSAITTDLQNRSAPEADQAHAEDLWNDAMDVTRAARLRLLNSPTGDPAEILAKVAVFACLSGGPVPEFKDGETCENALVASLLKDLAAMPSQPTPKADRADHDTALAAYHASSSAIGADKPRRYFEPGSSWAQIYADVPEELVRPSHHVPAVLRWRNSECVQRDLLVAPADKERVSQLVEHWAPILSQRVAENSIEDNAELDDAYFDAEEALFSTPAPDARSALLKAEMIERSTDDNAYGFDDLGLVSFKLNSHYEHRRHVWQFVDLLHLSGTDHPILHMAPFSPSVWIASFEAAGGIVSSPNLDDSVLFLTRGDRHCRRELNALLETPWQLRAVFMQAEHRRQGGGDPLVDCSGDYGVRDKRRGRERPKGPLGRGAHITFTDVAGQPAPVVAFVNLTWGLA